MFIYDRVAQTGALRGGDVGWETVIPVREGQASIILGAAEVQWLRACWKAAADTGGDGLLGEARPTITVHPDPALRRDGPDCGVASREVDPTVAGAAFGMHAAPHASAAVNRAPDQRVRP